MQPIEHIPLYFRTDDQRINSFLAKNRLHHEMSRLSNPVYKASIKLRANEGGNGRIRTVLMVCAVVALIYSTAWGG